MRFDNQVAIITGAGRGIGRALALEFAKEGAGVLINDIDSELAESVVQEIQKGGGQAVSFTGNVAQQAQAKEMIETAVREWGTVDILVNNAAVIRPALIQNMTEEEWDLVVNTGMKGVFNCIQAVAPVFIERGKRQPEALSNGKIVNVTSVAGLTGTVGQINYGAAKAGVIGITMSTAREWARFRIQSNAVAFGVVETRMTETIRGDKFADKYKEKIALNRFATTEDVVPGIMFLSSSGANYITGHVLNISGGYYIG